MWGPTSEFHCASVSLELCQSTWTLSLRKVLRDPWMIPLDMYEEDVNDSGGRISPGSWRNLTPVQRVLFSQCSFSSCIVDLMAKQSSWSLTSTWWLLFDRVYCLCEQVLSRSGWRMLWLSKVHWWSIELCVSEGFLRPFTGSWLQTGELEAWEKHECRFRPVLEVRRGS